MSRGLPPAGQQYYAPEIEAMPRADIEAMQLERLLAILPHAYENSALVRTTWESAGVHPRDIRSLEDHVTFLNTKINFLLDASLGLITVEQNEVIRVLTVAATVFFPPTLLGTIWGMNFQFMPELSWPIGYPLALLLLLASMVAPYLYFRRRGWL